MSPWPGIQAQGGKVQARHHHPCFKAKQLGKRLFRGEVAAGKHLRSCPCGYGGIWSNSAPESQRAPRTAGSDEPCSVHWKHYPRRGGAPSNPPCPAQQRCRTQLRQGPGEAPRERPRERPREPGPTVSGQRAPGTLHRPRARSAPGSARNYNSPHAPGPEKGRSRLPRYFLIDVSESHCASRGVAAPPMAGGWGRELLCAGAVRCGC